MKIKLCILFSILAIITNAQESEHLTPPVLYWHSYGFQKQVDFAKIAYYRSDSTGYESTMAEVISFNKEGKIIQKYISIFGKYPSQTAYNYIYKNGLLDSINTVSSAKNFNSLQKLHYDAKGKLQKIIATGVYTNFIETYTYDQAGMVASIERKHKNGSTVNTRFDHKTNVVVEKNYSARGLTTEATFVYDGDELFASFTTVDKNVVTFYDNYYRSHFKTPVNTNPLSYILDWRKKKHASLTSFQDQIGILRDARTSKIIYDIPAEARNQQGDWIKQLQIDRQLSTRRQLVFQQLKYADGTVSGGTEMDLLFERKVQRIK